MAPTAQPRGPATGIDTLDRAIGGLYWGDNVVWEVTGAVTAAPFFHVVSRQREVYDHAAFVALSDEPSAVRARFDGLVEVIDARPGRPFAAPAELLAEIERRCRESERSLLLFDPLEQMADRWGARTAGRFFTRCCPELLEFGAIAYWSLGSHDVSRDLRRDVEDVTQCVFVLSDDRLRIGKAEGRPLGAEGSVFRLTLENGLPRLSAAPVAARIGAALRATRVQRRISQSELARLAGVTPSAVSQAERGRRGLSLETLLTLAGKLNVTLDDLLRGEAPPGYVLARRREPGGDTGTRPLALLDDPATGLRAYLVRVPPGATRAPHLTHKGVELVVVARGLVQVALATGRPVLRGGELLLADQTPILSWRNLGQSTAVLFWILRDEIRR
jgi:transcriptional regulator with XRE-family HTH domain